MCVCVYVCVCVRAKTRDARADCGHTYGQTSCMSRECRYKSVGRMWMCFGTGVRIRASLLGNVS